MGLKKVEIKVKERLKGRREVTYQSPGTGTDSKWSDEHGVHKLKSLIINQGARAIDRLLTWELTSSYE